MLADAFLEDICTMIVLEKRYTQAENNAGYASGKGPDKRQIGVKGK